MPSGLTSLLSQLTKLSFHYHGGNELAVKHNCCKGNEVFKKIRSEYLSKNNEQRTNNRSKKSRLTEEKIALKEELHVS
jgi:hypothetical protein